MTSRLTCVVFVLCAFSLPCALAAEPISIQMSVRLRDVPGDKTGKPLEGVGGFAIKRSSDAAFAGASCPNASNKQGDFGCKVVCTPNDADLQLLVHPPTQERSRIVAGLAPPSAPSVEIVGCQLSNKQPIVIIYKTVSVALDDLNSSNPELVQAITMGTSGGYTFKPFADSAPTLQALSAKSTDRAAIVELARIAAAFRAAPPEQRPAAVKGADFSQYAVGLNSVLLRAAVIDAGSAPAAASKVKVSSDAADFQRSLAAVQKAYEAKALLNEKEIFLANQVRLMKKEPRLVNVDRFQLENRGSVLR